MTKSIGLTGWVVSALLFVTLAFSQGSREPLVNRSTQATGSATALDAESLKKMLEGLGYTPKNIGTKVGEEQYEFDHETDAMAVPLAAEISPSKNYVWISVLIGKAQPLSSTNSANFHKLLSVNADIQPCHFYLSSTGYLYMAIAVDNRAITPAILKSRITKMAEDCSGNRELWRQLTVKS